MLFSDRDVGEPDLETERANDVLGGRYGYLEQA
jgi:hypothetical protein